MTISFSDFVYFVNAVEDKTTETALNIWFQVCDLNSDGILSMKEVEELFFIQKQQMMKTGIDSMKFESIISQFLDLTNVSPTNLNLSSIRKSGDWSSLFNILVDLKQFFEIETKDPLFIPCTLR